MSSLTKIIRRHFLRVTPFAWLIGIRQRARATHVDRHTGLSLSEWLRRERAALPALIQALANMERRGVQCEQPATWYSLNYVGAIPWRPGVVLVYAFGRRSEARASFDHAATWLEEAGVSTLALGWSDDQRAWARFVLCDRATVEPLVRSVEAPLSFELAANRLGRHCPGNVVAGDSLEPSA